MSIDQIGNVHLPAGAPGGGQFAGRVNAAPTGPLTETTDTFVRAWPKPLPLETAESNWILAGFEEEYPEQTPTDMRAFLSDVPVEWVEDGSGYENRVYDGDARRGAVRTVCARLAAGQGGLLTEVAALKAGDRVDLSRLWTTDDYPPYFADWAASNYGIVEDRAWETADGDVIVRFSNEAHPLVLPIGAAVPVQAITFHGQQFTERELVEKLVAAGELSPAAKDMVPRDALDQYITANGLEPGDIDYPEVLL